MGWTDALFGGLGASTNVGDYTNGAQYQSNGLIQSATGQGIAQNMGQAAPTIAPDFRNAQLAQMAQLQAIASGQQMGAGELAAQRQGQNAAAQQMAMAHMARGGNAALAQLGAQRQVAGIGVNTAGQSQQAAMQDQMNAQGTLAGITNAGRAGDLGVAGMQQNQQSINNTGALGYLGALGNMDQGQLAAATASMQAKNQQQGMLGGLMQVGGTLGGAAIMHSDEALKTNIKDAGRMVDEALSQLAAKHYSYKDEKHGKGARIGILAQDMERSEVGRSIVLDAEDGKALDVNKALSLSLAANARLHQRLSKLEASK